MSWNSQKLLDHGVVYLLDAMPHWSGDHATGLTAADARIVQAARVSMAHLPPEIQRELGLVVEPEERSIASNENLIRYLMRNAHTSPFEKVRFEFFVKLPIFVARQWIRHRTGSFNEVSARYAQLPCEFYVPEPERMQAQSSSNKQASGDKLPRPIAQDCAEEINATSFSAYLSYEHMLNRGLARELARMVLPTNFYTQWYWTVDLHNLFHFLKLRLHPHAQYEIRVYAEAMLAMVERVAPVATAAFRSHILREEKPA